MNAKQVKRNVIKVTPNEDGRVIIKLYGKEIEIDKSMIKRGRAVIHKFGEEYEVVISKTTTPDVEANEAVHDEAAQSVGSEQDAESPVEEGAKKSEESDETEEE